MFWNEEENLDNFQAPQNVIDLSFKISCQQIKLDHAWSLTDAISDLVPWIKDEPQLAIHHIYIPQAGNGWERVDNFQDELIQLSRRTRLKIRVPNKKITQLQAITGETITVDGNKLTFGQPETHLLSTMTTIIARHVHIPETDDDEDLFLRIAQKQINALGIQVRKMLCGKSHQLKTTSGIIKTRSLMVADISPDESILLQEKGIGDYYRYGCGIFIPQKGITAVNSSD